MKDMNEISKKVLKNSGIPEDEKFGSILIAIMVIGIIVNVVRVIQECEEDETKNYNKTEYCAFLRNKIAFIANRKKLMDIMRLKRILRRNLTPEAYQKYKNKLTSGILKTGTELTENETYTLLESSNG